MLLTIVTADVVWLLSGDERLERQGGSSKWSLVSHTRWGGRKGMELAPSYRTRQQRYPFCLNRCWDGIAISFGVCKEGASHVNQYSLDEYM